MNRITIDSFGADVPENWEEIAAFLNRKLEDMGMPESGELNPDDYDAYCKVWDDYWKGALENAPTPIQ